MTLLSRSPLLRRLAQRCPQSSEESLRLTSNAIGPGRPLVIAREMTEAISQARARDTHGLCQSRNGPVASRLFVKQSESVADDRITRAAQPSDLIRRQRGDIAPQSFDEQNLREFSVHERAAPVRSLRIAN